MNARRAVDVSATPVAEILEPINGDKLKDWQLPFTVQGNVLAPGGTVGRWRLTLREKGAVDSFFLRDGHSEAQGAPLAVLDRDIWERGKRYVLELEVSDTAAHTARDSKEFLVPDRKFAVIPLPAPGPTERSQGGRRCGR